MTPTFDVHVVPDGSDPGTTRRATMRPRGGPPQEVVLKQVASMRDIGMVPGALERLRDEARLLERLNHPRIPRSHGLHTLDDVLVLVLAFVPGTDLADLIAPPRLGVRAAVEAIGTVATTLAELAARTPEGHLAHRDLKPENLRLTPTGEVVLLDFGLGLASGVPRGARTRSGEVVGTLAYLAPERAAARGGTPAGDVYALGCVLFELVAGHALRAGLTAADCVRMLREPDVHDPLVSRSLASLSLPSAVHALLSDLLLHAPEGRPSHDRLATRARRIAAQLPGDTLASRARALHASLAGGTP